MTPMRESWISVRLTTNIEAISPVRRRFGCISHLRIHSTREAKEETRLAAQIVPAQELPTITMPIHVGRNVHSTRRAAAAADSLGQPAGESIYDH
jgi:hypothetical protein